ncbi:MAG TPA: arginine repressor [Gemmatimonadaceae bacterium]|nr:arginine repressor [Gemmatimonadaceae bacterium]
MTAKSQRQSLIVELVGSEHIGSQEELRGMLRSRGMNATQATLSRDLRELGLVRVPSDDGPRYRLPEMVAGEAAPSIDVLLPQLFSRIDGVGELIVLHTLPSGAQPISEAIDAAAWREVLGTIAGENTILIVCRSAQAREAVTAKLHDLAHRGGR